MVSKTQIAGFSHNYRFLSNFYPSSIEFEGLTYTTVEHAYQAAKTQDRDLQLFINNLKTAGEAKRAGRNLLLRPDWDDVKIPIMRTLLRKKFYDPVLRAALDATGDAELIEENYWHDNFWGRCSCAKCASGPNTNWLGKLLMEIRDGD